VLDVKLLMRGMVLSHYLSIESMSFFTSLLHSSMPSIIKNFLMV